jgi:hypothetical protein
MGACTSTQDGGSSGGSGINNGLPRGSATEEREQRINTRMIDAQLKEEKKKNGKVGGKTKGPPLHCILDPSFPSSSSSIPKNKLTFLSSSCTNFFFLVQVTLVSQRFANK